MSFIFSIVGLYLGAMIADWEGALFGLVLGFLFGAYINLKNRVRTVEDELKLVKSNLVDSVATTSSPRETKREVAPVFTAESPEETEEQIDDAPTIVPPPSVEPQIEDESESDADVERAPDEWVPPPPKEPGVLDKGLAWLKDFFTTGNVVVKIGVIILFFGVGFLIRYAVERQVLPIELRLAGIALGGIVMFIFGWRLRHSKRAYALVLQGGAVGVLYLTVFAMAKTYYLMPPSAALLVMILLVGFSGMLAYLQDARSLAVFATVGGFLAPILASTGSGNHVILFSYYVVLNTGILGLAWFRTWRILNWIGFVFTFVIASFWGIKFYQPIYFNSVEPFLILFFLFYLAISILFTHRQPPKLKGLVDASLVFGVPIVAFTLQSALVREIEFGRAYSALAMAAIYIGLAKVLWHKQIEGMRLLTEAFLALGVIFASLAIPFALDGRWTAAAWAVEGAGMVWIGIRQGRVLARSFGLLLQGGAAIAFLGSFYTPAGVVAILNSAYIGCVLISVAALFSAFYYYRNREGLHKWEQAFNILLLMWGLAWWFAAGLMEIDIHVTGRFELNSVLFFFAVSFMFLSILARRLDWRPASVSTCLLLPAMVLSAGVQFVDNYGRNPFSNLGYISWLTAFVIQYGLLYRNDFEWPEKLLGLWHTFSLWLLTFMLTWVAAEFCDDLIKASNIWSEILWGVLPAIIVAVLVKNRERLSWPLESYEDSYYQSGIFVLTAYCLFWLFISCFMRGNPAPLDYFPIFNPLELSQLVLMFILLGWILNARQGLIPTLRFIKPETLVYILAASAFFWLNAVVARSVHFFYGVRFNPDALHHSAIFQASISIVWTIVALIMTVLATRLGKRRLWILGTVLIGIVALKLFLVDLKDSGTLARVVSFLSVGILVSIIGYFSPPPPKPESNAV